MAEYICKAKLKEAFEQDGHLSAYVEEMIDSLPDADVRPVVHGRWVQTGGKYSRHKTIDRRILTCSVCGNFLYMGGVNAGRGNANFCPNCGSDMRGMENEKA